jgi:hypothetical protein
MVPSKGELLCSQSLLQLVHSANAGQQPLNLEASGVEVVLAHTLYALIGALSLEKGNLVANKVARERILAPLGLQVTV